MDVGETKSVSGGTVYWALDDDGNVKSFVAGREYDSALEATPTDIRLGGQPGVVQMNSVGEARRASLGDFANTIEPLSPERRGGFDRDGNERRI